MLYPYNGVLTALQQKRMNYWYGQQYGCISNALCYVNEARLKKLITTWFYLHDILEKAKSQGGKTDQRLPGSGGREELVA